MALRSIQKKLKLLLNGRRSRQSDVRAFLETAGYYHKLVRHFASIAAPLCQLINKGAQWKWSELQQKAFDRLKSELAVTPVLKCPVAGAPYILDTDASLTGIGAVLSQVIDGKERVLGIAGKSLSKSERNYCVTMRELLAVIYFVKHYHPYLYGREFTIRTDHSSLQWLLRFREPEGQNARWMQTLGNINTKFYIVQASTTEMSMDLTECLVGNAKWWTKIN